MVEAQSLPLSPANTPRVQVDLYTEGDGPLVHCSNGVAGMTDTGARPSPAQPKHNPQHIHLQAWCTAPTSCKNLRRHAAHQPQAQGTPSMLQQGCTRTSRLGRCTARPCLCTTQVDTIRRYCPTRPTALCNNEMPSSEGHTPDRLQHTNLLNTQIPTTLLR